MDNMKKTLVALPALALCTVLSAWPQTQALDALYEKMTAVVLANNPVLISQNRLVEESSRLKQPAGGLSIPGLDLGAAVGLWDPDTNTPAFAPSLNLGVSISFNDPARELNGYRITQEKEKARQDWENAKNTVLSELFSRVRDIQKLKTQAAATLTLQKYLKDYSVAARMQGGPEASISPDKMWDLMERLANVTTELDTASSQLETMMMETAMRLGGAAWKDLLELLRQIQAS